MKDKLIAIFFTILPHHLISRLVGSIAHCEVAWVKNTLINWFIKQYHVDMNESKIKNPTQFKNFNDFFTRELDANARQINQTPGGVICPVDGGISELGRIEGAKMLQAKGEYYTIEALLADGDDAKRFYNGVFNTIYLAPKDYHRIHMPFTGKLIKMTYVPGRLFSVNPSSVTAIPNLFARNERVIAYFETEIGVMAVVFVGAMIVASIATGWAGIVAPDSSWCVRNWTYADQNQVVFEKGDEIGCFQLGSTVIVLFENESQVQWTDGLSSGDSVKMGQFIGTTKLSEAQ